MLISANHPPEDGVWRYDGPFVSIQARYVNWEKVEPIGNGLVVMGKSWWRAFMLTIKTWFMDNLSSKCQRL